MVFFAIRPVERSRLAQYVTMKQNCNGDEVVQRLDNLYYQTVPYACRSLLGVTANGPMFRI